MVVSDQEVDLDPAVGARFGVRVRRIGAAERADPLDPPRPELGRAVQHGGEVARRDGAGRIVAGDRDRGRPPPPPSTSRR